MTQLMTLELHNNSISDISPLVANLGLGSGDFITVFSNLLDTGACPDLQALFDRGVSVQHDVNCP